MKNKIIIKFMILMMIPAVVYGGARSEGRPVKLFESSDIQPMNPVWSPDGNFIAFTGALYKGIWIIDREGKDARQITDEHSAGYGFKWSSNSQALLARASRYERFRRFNAVKVYDMKLDSVIQITEDRTFMPHLPYWAEADQKIVLYGREGLEVFESGIEVSGIAKENLLPGIVFLKDAALGVSLDGTADYQTITPFEDSRILNPAISPDGTKIAFEIMGGNLFVMHSDGSRIIDLGTGNRPAWSPDSEYIVYMITEDDGYNITASDLFTIKSDGTDKSQLTLTADRHEMNPDWSPDGRFIIYDGLNESAIYKLEIFR